MNKTKGFTIIELIVVIAIIAVLAAIVMVNVTQYINKGKDAAVQGNLASVMTNAAVYAETATDLSAVCDAPAVASALAAADKAFDGDDTANEVTDCNDAAAAWAACGQLKGTDSYFCVDSTGAKKTIGTRATCVTGWAPTVCP
jgi:prepilin-type N-terminal cleavage/methylation domain-containing protein